MKRAMYGMTGACLSILSSAAMGAERAGDNGGIGVETIGSHRATLDRVVIKPVADMLQVSGVRTQTPMHRELIMGSVYVEALDTEGQVLSAQDVNLHRRTERMGFARLDVLLDTASAPVATVRLTHKWY